jgi:hypothetical protein
MSTVSASVTRRPLTNSLFFADFFEHIRNFRPAAVHKHDLDPDERQQHDVAHDGFLNSSLIMALPPYLMTINFIRVFLDVGERLDENLRRCAMLSLLSGIFVRLLYDR